MGCLCTWLLPALASWTSRSLGTSESFADGWGQLREVLPLLLRVEGEADFVVGYVDVWEPLAMCSLAGPPPMISLLWYTSGATFSSNVWRHVEFRHFGIALNTSRSLLHVVLLRARTLLFVCFLGCSFVCSLAFGLGHLRLLILADFQRLINTLCHLQKIVVLYFDVFLYHFLPRGGATFRPWPEDRWIDVTVHEASDTCFSADICNHFQLITDGALPGSHGCCSAVNSETGDARGNELTYERLSFRRSVEDANFNADTDLVWLSYVLHQRLENRAKSLRPSVDVNTSNVWRNELSSLHSRLRVRRADLIDELASFAVERGILCSVRRKPGEVDCLSRGIFMPYSANQGLVYRFWSPHQIRAIFEREEPGGTFAAPHHRGQDDFATIVDAIFRDRDFFRRRELVACVIYNAGSATLSSITRAHGVMIENSKYGWLDSRCLASVWFWGLAVARQSRSASAFSNVLSLQANAGLRVVSTRALFMDFALASCVPLGLLGSWFHASSGVAFLRAGAFGTPALDSISWLPRQVDAISPACRPSLIRFWVTHIRQHLRPVCTPV
ncbi:FMN-linked oxidoreductase [Hortaea werneckii]|nr:FMN-linked oxidoreductase [Hortaea werneckii]